MEWNASGFVKRLREARAASPLPTDRIARLAEVDRHTLRRHLKGVCKRGPTLSTISAYAKVLEVSPAWLAWGQGEMKLEKDDEREAA